MKNTTNHKAMFRTRLKLLIPLATVLLCVPLTAFAQEAFNFDNTVNEVFQFFALLLTAMQAVLWPILLLMGGLLSNDLLFSGGMNTMLLSIWAAMRDFVNIIFVMGLLFVAIYNIVGMAGENYAIGKVLPRIALALIAVNFSFLMAKVVLDAVNVTTTAIFALPLAQDSLSTNKSEEKMQEFSSKFCEKIMNLEGQDKTKENAYCTAETKPAAAGAAATPADPAKPTTVAGSAKSTLTDYGKKFFSNFNGRNVAIVMAVELMEITNIDEIKKSDGTIKDIKSLAINTIFSLIFFVIYATAFIALFVTLLVRIVVLWATIALMPISFLGMAFTDVKTKLGENDPLSVFLNHALVPVKVAIALTIGMIMITQLKQTAPSALYATDPTSLGALTSNMSSLQDILAGVATAAVIWMAAFFAMKGTKASPFVDKISGYVQNFGTGLAKLPLYAPILPVKNAKGETEKVGLAFLGGSSTPMDKIFNKERERYGKITENKGDILKTEIDKAQSKAEMDKILAKLSADETSYGQTREALAAKLAADNNKLAMTYEKAWREMKFGSAGEFVEAVKTGKRKNGDAFEYADFKKFVNDKAGIKADHNVGMETTKYNNAASPYLDTNHQKTPIGDAAKKLKEASEKLSKADNKPDVDKAKEEAKKAYDEFQKFEQQKTNFTVNLNGATPDNMNKIPEGLGQQMRTQYEALEKVVGTNDAKTTLTAALTKAGISDPVKASAIAQNIINGNFAPATQPAAAAAAVQPPAPAAAAPSTTPTPGTPGGAANPNQPAPPQQPAAPAPTPPSTTPPGSP